MTLEKMPQSGAASSEETARFYNRLMTGEEERGILGKDNRYNPLELCEKPSVIRHFDGFIRPLMSPEDAVLDFGCGPGTFSLRMAQYCKSIVAVDISEEFVKQATRSFESKGVTNSTAMLVPPDRLPFDTASFDAVLMVDVIHHLDDISTSIAEVIRVLKPGGKIIVFEPNKLNPLIWLIHYFDKNERGLLALGTPRHYKRILGRYTSKFHYRFNGIVIGPQSKGYDLVASFMNHRLMYPLLGWLNPKIAVYAEANDGE